MGFWSKLIGKEEKPATPGAWPTNSPEFKAAYNLDHGLTTTDRHVQWFMDEMRRNEMQMQQGQIPLPSSPPQQGGNGINQSGYLYSDDAPAQQQPSTHPVIAQYGGPQQFSPAEQEALTEARRPKAWNGGEFSAGFSTPQQPSTHPVIAEYGRPQQFSPAEQAALTEARRPKWGAELSQPSAFAIPAGNEKTGGGSSPAAQSRYMQTQVMPAVQQPPSHTSKGTLIMPAVTPPPGPGGKK